MREIWLQSNLTVGADCVFVRKSQNCECIFNMVLNRGYKNILQAVWAYPCLWAKDWLWVHCHVCRTDILSVLGSWNCTFLENVLCISEKTLTLLYLTCSVFSAWSSFLTRWKSGKTWQIYPPNSENELRD